MTRVASLVGWSGSGKTTLISRAIAECRRRGISCAAAKQARHAPDIAPEGKDSTIFLAQGAAASAYLGDSDAAIFLPAPALRDRAWFLGILPHAEVLFLEGAVVEGALRVLVAGEAGVSAELKRPLGETDILVARDPELRRLAEGMGLRVLHPDDIGAFVDILMSGEGTDREERGGSDMDEVHGENREREAIILCDGKNIPLVPFVEKLFARTIEAMTGSLKGAEKAREITITLRDRN
jgi:molybdopterin-guanine dinucleotide biosynthesis protein MobB